MSTTDWAELSAKSQPKYPAKQGRRIVSTGTYPVVVTAAAITKSKADNDMLRISYVIVEGDFAGESLTHYLVIKTPRDVQRIERTVSALGANPHLDASLDQFAVTLLGLRADVQVSWDTADAKYPTLEVHRADDTL